MIKKSLLLVMILIFIFTTQVFAAEKMDLKVLVIEINPILTSITNKKLYPNNDGHPKVSEYFGQKTNKAINELKQDLEFASHGYLNIKIKTEYLNEFPRYTATINGTNSHRFSEKLYLKYAASKDNRDKGDWYNLVTYNVFDMIAPYSFDYEYLIKKFDLVKRRNAGEFDQVWINSIDPIQTYETVMVGKTAYWINGTPIIKNCNNFMIANICIARRDANLHALGHGVEGIMSHVFNGTNFSYDKRYNDSSKKDFESLNLWEQFSMTSSESAGNNSGIGNVHFPFNAGNAYDYTNKNKVYSYWKNWLTYPDLSGKKQLFNSDAWLKWDKNTSLGDDQDKDPDRLYMRLWFYLFPHIGGTTKDGYLNNWWKYFVTLDYVTNIKCKFNFKKYTNVKGELSEPLFTAEYASETKKDILFGADFAYFTIKDSNVIKINANKKLEIVGAGSTVIYCYADGKFNKYAVSVIGKAGDYEVRFIAGSDTVSISKIDIKNKSSVIELSNENEKTLIEINVKYSNGTEELLSPKSNFINVKVGDEKICSIDSAGYLIAHIPGKTSIICSCGNVSTAFTVNVLKKETEVPSKEKTPEKEVTKSSEEIVNEKETTKSSGEVTPVKSTQETVAENSKEKSKNTSFKITTKAEGGTILPENPTIKSGFGQAFYFEANDGYEIYDVIVDGKSIGKVKSFALKKVNKKHTIQLICKEDSLINWKKASDWALDELSNAKALDLIPNVLNKKDFTQEITREQFALVALRLYEKLSNNEVVTDIENPFVDTSNEDILKAYSVGITLGVSDNMFMPNSKITREQMVTMLTRAIEKSRK